MTILVGAVDQSLHTVVEQPPGLVVAVAMTPGSVWAPQALQEPRTATAHAYIL
jgi:hypothetical protein